MNPVFTRNFAAWPAFTAIVQCAMKQRACVHLQYSRFIGPIFHVSHMARILLFVVCLVSIMLFIAFYFFISSQRLYATVQVLLSHTSLNPEVPVCIFYFDSLFPASSHFFLQLPSSIFHLLPPSTFHHPHLYILPRIPSTSLYSISLTTTSQDSILKGSSSLHSPSSFTTLTFVTIFSPCGFAHNSRKRRFLLIRPTSHANPKESSPLLGNHSKGEVRTIYIPYVPLPPIEAPDML